MKASLAPVRVASICQGTRLLWCSILGEEDHIAGFEVRVAPGLRHEVDALGRAAREDDFVGAAALMNLAARARAASKAMVERLLNSCMPRWTLALSRS